MSIRALTVALMSGAALAAAQLPAVAATDFIAKQSAGEQSSSGLIGTKIQNSAGETIGDVNYLVLDANGAVSTVVIGVGGFLGVGEKDVAVSFKELKITRDQNDGDVDKVTVNYNKDQLKSAPEFKSAEAQRANRTNTTGSGGVNNNTRTPNTNR